MLNESPKIEYVEVPIKRRTFLGYLTAFGFGTGLGYWGRLVETEVKKPKPAQPNIELDVEKVAQDDELNINNGRLISFVRGVLRINDGSNGGVGRVIKNPLVIANFGKNTGGPPTDINKIAFAWATVGADNTYHVKYQAFNAETMQFNGAFPFLPEQAHLELSAEAINRAWVKNRAYDADGAPLVETTPGIDQGKPLLVASEQAA